MQVNGGSQSFNVVNTLRVLGRWMRMVTIPNQSSVPKVRGRGGSGLLMFPVLGSDLCLASEKNLVNGSDLMKFQAWTEFDGEGRMKPSSLRDRVVDVAEELFKFTLLLRPHTDVLVDRYSEREERRVKGRLLSQAEKEAAKPPSS